MDSPAHPSHDLSPGMCVDVSPSLLPPPPPLRSVTWYVTCCFASLARVVVEMCYLLLYADRSVLSVSAESERSPGQSS